MAKDSFIMRKKYQELVGKLSTTQKAERVDAVFMRQTTGGVMENLDPLVDMLLAMMKQERVKDNVYYEEVCERNSINGKKGGARKGNQNAVKGWEKVSKQPKTTQNNPKQAKQADNDSDNDSDIYNPPISPHKGEVGETPTEKNNTLEKLYSEFYGASKGIDRDKCDKIIKSKLKQGATLDDIRISMVLYNCSCRLKPREEYRYVKKLENWLREFSVLSKTQVESELYRIIGEYKQRKKSDENYKNTEPCKRIRKDLCDTFGKQRANDIFTNIGAPTINLKFIT